MLAEIQLDSPAEESEGEEFPEVLGFRKASDHNPEDFEKVDKAVCFHHIPISWLYNLFHTFSS